jgi:hypothetical protein
MTDTELDFARLKPFLLQAVKAIGLWDFDAPTFSLDNRLTDGGKVVSLKRRLSFTPRNIPGTHFC